MITKRIILPNRYKTISNAFLEHSEWIRKLRTPSIIGIASVLTIPFGIFIITPYVVTYISGPSAILSLLIAFIIMIISGMHMNELISSMPKNCLLYNFTYTNFGEIAAFLVGWISLLDFIISIVIVAKNWSSHMNLLFHGFFNNHFTLPIPYLRESIFAAKIDFFAVLAIFIVSFLLCCSIRVLTTVSITMVTICILATNSAAFVGFYFADPNNWLTAGFFKNGTTGVVKGASNYLCAYIGVETISFLLEETKSPRKRLPFIIPAIIIILTLLMFLTTMVITLAADVSKYPNDMLFPDIFDNLEIPSAKYVMTIGSVCGLSGTLFAIFIPSTRILTSLCGDNLLPLNLLAHTSKKRGVPYYAVFLCALISSSLVILNTSKLFGIIAFSTPLRLILLGCLVYDQHYSPNVVGLFRETAFYRGIHCNRYKKQSLNFYSDDQYSHSINVSRESSSRWTTDDESSDRMSSYENIRNIIAQQEIQREQWLEKSQSLAENLMEKTIKLCNRKQLSLLSFNTTEFGHNCTRSPCTSCISAADKKKPNFHLFEYDFPQMLYSSNYPGSMHSSEDFDKKTGYKRSMRTLLFFILTSVIIGFLTLKIERSLQKLYSILLTLMACIVLGYLVINITRQKINPINRERSCKTPAFPYLTLFAIFLAILTACTTDCITITGFIIWIVIGIILYLLYGYRHSKEGCGSFNGLIITNGMIKDSSSTGIMNDRSDYQSAGIML